MAKVGKMDGMIMGAILGLALTTPKVGEWVSDLITSITPTSWLVIGDYSLTIFGIIFFGLLGLIFDKSR